MNIQKDFEQTLREQGYKITKQRRLIIGVFLKDKHKLFNAQQIYNKVKKNYPSVDFSTIYRNIELLAEKDMIHKINTGESYACYKFKEKNQHHHHIICKNCGKTEVIEFCPFKEMEEQLKEKDFITTEHSFEVFGYCANCKQK